MSPSKNSHIGTFELHNSKIMKYQDPVSNIMSSKLITVNRDTHNLRDVSEIFRKEKIRHIPVMDGHELIGIISRNDVMRLSFGGVFMAEAEEQTILDMLTVEQIMSHKPRCVEHDTPIGAVARILVDEKFHSLPVLKNGELKGIVTSTDIIEYMLAE